MLSTINIRRETNQGVNGDVMRTALDVEPQIFALVTEKLPVFEDDPNFFGQPSRNPPELPRFWAVDSCIQNKDCRDAMNCFSCRK